MADQPPESPISIIRMAQGGAAKEVKRAEEESRRAEESNAALFVAVEELSTLRHEKGMVPGGPEAEPNITRMAQPGGAAKELERVEDERREWGEQMDAIAKRNGFTWEELFDALVQAQGRDSQRGH